MTVRATTRIGLALCLLGSANLLVADPFDLRPVLRIEGATGVVDDRHNLAFAEYEVGGITRYGGVQETECCELRVQDENEFSLQINEHLVSARTHLAFVHGGHEKNVVAGERCEVAIEVEMGDTPRGSVESFGDKIREGGKEKSFSAATFDPIGWVIADKFFVLGTNRVHVYRLIRIHSENGAHLHIG